MKIKIIKKDNFLSPQGFNILIFCSNPLNVNKENTTPTQNPGPVLIVYRVSLFPPPTITLRDTHTHIHITSEPTLSQSQGHFRHTIKTPPQNASYQVCESLSLSLSLRFLTHTHTHTLSPKTAFLFKSFPSLFSLSPLSLHG